MNPSFIRSLNLAVAIKKNEVYISQRKVDAAEFVIKQDV